MQLERLHSLANAPREACYKDGEIVINLTFQPNALTAGRMAQIAKDLAPFMRKDAELEKRVTDLGAEADAADRIEATADRLAYVDEGSAAVNEIYCRALVDYVTAWDITVPDTDKPDAEMPLPCTLEGFQRLPPGLPERLFTFCRNDAEPKKTAQADGLTNGAASDSETPAIIPPGSLTETAMATVQTTQ